MASIHSPVRENGRAISTMRNLPRPLSIKALPPTPLLAEIPPTPNGVELPDAGIDTKDPPPVIHPPKPKVAPLSHADIPHNASHRRSSSSSRVHLNRHSSLMPGRSSSENTAVSIFSMYTEETEAILEAAEEDLPTSHYTRGASAETRSPERPTSSKRSGKSQGSTELSISADTVAALLCTDAPAGGTSVASQGAARFSVPDSICLPYDEGFNTAPEPPAPDVIRILSGRSVGRPTTAGSSLLSVSRDRPTSSGRTSVAMSSRPSSELHSSIDNMSTSTALLPPLPPSRNSSRTSQPISAEASGPSQRLSQSRPLPPMAPPTLSPDFTPKQNRSTSALTTTLSQPRSHRGADEEADAEFVRSVYAHFDVGGGAPGDGYEEGVERTRARLSSGVQQSETTPQPNPGSDIDEKEQRRLRELDRYGFFAGATSMRQESRLTLLPSAPLGKKVKRLKPSAPVVPASQNATPLEVKSAPPDKPPTNEIGRLKKWQAMMRPIKKDPGGNTETWTPTGHGSSMATFRRRVWKGVPDRWRPAVWQMLIDDACERHHSRVTQAELQRHFRDNIDVPSKHDVQIDLDVPRTVSGHVLFHTRYGQGQRALFHALHCFSLRCSECEYVQGMGPIVATLLFYFDTERAYANIVRIHDEYGMHSVFRPGFPGLLEAIYIQERLVERIMPDVYRSFQKNLISSTSYVTKWYITLFANSFPFQTQLRIWDAFFLEGRDVIIVVAVAIIWVLKDYLSSPQADFETILSLLSSYFIVEDEDAFIDWVRRTLESQEIRSAMTNWRNTWEDLVAQGRHHDALL